MSVWEKSGHPGTLLGGRFLQAISKKFFGPISALDRGSKSSTYLSMPAV